MAPLYVQWMRHGRIASHRGDVPLTDEGRLEAIGAGRKLAERLDQDELVFVLTTSTRRSKETAHALCTSMSAALPAGVEIRDPAEEWAIRNPDIFIAGIRVEMVSTAEAMAEQTTGVDLSVEQIANLEFYREFFPSRDRIGYWVRHPDPPGENADAVARRLMAYAQSLLDAPSERTRRYICVTHSPVIRAFLQRYLLEEDLGEPGFCETVDMVFPEDGMVRISYREYTRHSALATIGDRPRNHAGITR